MLMINEIYRFDFCVYFCIHLFTGRVAEISNLMLLLISDLLRFLTVFRTYPNNNQCQISCQTNDISKANNSLQRKFGFRRTIKTFSDLKNKLLCRYLQISAIYELGLVQLTAIFNAGYIML